MEQRMRYLGRGLRVGSWTVAVAAFVIVVAPWSASAQSGGGVVGGGPPSVAGQSAAQIEAYWTPERMKNAIPMEVSVPASTSQAQPTLESLPPTANPGFAPGWAPGSATQPDPYLIFEVQPGGNLPGLITGEGAPQTSPPFVPPANPTDFGNYAPFQRWSWLGKYLTYPISTIGKLFFSQDHDGNGSGSNFVCTASVINRSTIATAGHCVSNGLNGAGFNNGVSYNYLFCPSYNQGGVNPAVGCWAGVGQFTSGLWFSSSAFDRDYGCIITAASGTIINNRVGNVTGWTGRAVNWPTRQAEFAFGYPQGAPFAGNIIIATASPEWYQVDMFPGDGLVSKYIGSDQTGGSSGGPWWLNLLNPGVEIGDTDGSGITDPAAGQCCPWINGVNSHKRCTAAGCPAGTIFTQEMGSPQFRGTAGDNGESEDVFAACFGNGGS